MLIRDLSIDKGSWLSDVMKEIPTNTILNKVMTGCGATTLEINAARHSIIIEPNVPVIIGKKAQHDFLFAVYEGTTREDVKAYLLGEEDGYRKIITTPEGFDKKVLPAMYETNTPIFEDYFLLFDECEKAIQDVGYRGDIYLPVEDFFKFENKAMVSATPIVPSDPRFEEQGFEMIRIVPTYDYCKDLTVVVTNNTVCVLRKLLERYRKAGEKVCIFILLGKECAQTQARGLCRGERQPHRVGRGQFLHQPLLLGRGHQAGLPAERHRTDGRIPCTVLDDRPADRGGAGHRSLP